MTDQKNMGRVDAGVQWGRRSRAICFMALALSVALLLGAAACEPGEPQAEDRGGGETARSREEGTAPIVASIFPVSDLVASLAAPEIGVATLLGPATSPATFDPTPRAVRQVQGARLLFSMGAGLDAWTSELLDTAPGARAVTLLEGTPLRGSGHEEGTGNPHIWLDPIRTRDVLVPRLVEALVEAFPDDRDAIRERERALTDSLTALDREIRRATASLPHRAFVASHAAWTYFAERYDLVQVGVIHEHPGQESSPQGLANLVDRARSAGVPVVFSEIQIPDVGARALADELGVPVISLDPLGGAGVAERDSYLALLRYNTGQFVRGLGRISPTDGGAP